MRAWPGQPYSVCPSCGELCPPTTNEWIVEWPPVDIPGREQTVSAEIPLLTGMKPFRIEVVVPIRRGLTWAHLPFSCRCGACWSHALKRVVEQFNAKGPEL